MTHGCIVKSHRGLGDRMIDFRPQAQHYRHGFLPRYPPHVLMSPDTYPRPWFHQSVCYNRPWFPPPLNHDIAETLQTVMINTNNRTHHIQVYEMYLTLDIIIRKEYSLIIHQTTWNYIEMREWMDNWVNDFWLPLKKYGQLGRDEKFSLFLQKTKNVPTWYYPNMLPTMVHGQVFCIITWQQCQI